MGFPDQQKIMASLFKSSLTKKSLTDLKFQMENLVSETEDGFEREGLWTKGRKWPEKEDLISPHAHSTSQC